MLEIMDMRELSDRIKTPVPTLRYWRSRGTGPRSFRIEGRVFYLARDVDEWIAEQYAASDEQVTA